MADNLSLNASTTSGGILATDDVGGIHYQLIKLAFGALDAATIVSASDPLPVTGDLSLTGSVSVVLSGPVSLTGSFMDTVNNAIQVNVVAGSAGGTEFNEDAAHNTGDAGTQILAVRNDTLASLVDADGDYSPLQVDENGAVYVVSGNFISTNNSTTTPLGISGVFTGTGDDCLGYATVAIMLDSDQDSTVGGMTFQFSTDNTNWDDIYSFTYTAADGARRFQFPVCARYFRIVYTNNTTGQTHFRVQTILHPTSIPTSIHRVGDNVDPDRSAELIKAVLIAQAAGSGDFTPIDATAGGNLKVSVEEAAPLSLSSSYTVQVSNTVNTEVVGDVSLTGSMSVFISNVPTVSISGSTTVVVSGTPTVALTSITGSFYDSVNDALQVNIVAGSASGTEYTEDAIAAANPSGTQPVMVANTTPALEVVDADVVAQRATRYGAAYAQIVDSSGNFVDTFGGSGGTASTDDGAFTAGAGQGTPAMGFFSADLVDAGDVGVLAMDAQRRLFITQSAS